MKFRRQQRRHVRKPQSQGLWTGPSGTTCLFCCNSAGNFNQNSRCDLVPFFLLRCHGDAVFIYFLTTLPKTNCSAPSSQEHVNNGMKSLVFISRDIDATRQSDMCAFTKLHTFVVLPATRDLWTHSESHSSEVNTAVCVRKRTDHCSFFLVHIF